MAESPLKIDVHVHVAGNGASGSGCRLRLRRPRSLSHRYLALIAGIPLNKLSSFDELYVRKLLERVRGSLLDRVVLLALDGFHDSAGRLVPELSPLYTPNRYVLDLADRHEEFLAGVSIHPGRRDAFDELARCVEEGAVLLKWLPNVQGFDPSDTAHRPFLEKVAARRLPLLCHTGREFSLPARDQGLGDPTRLIPALEEGITVIAAHSGVAGLDLTRWGLRKLCNLAEKFPNLYVDISALTLPRRGSALKKVLKNEILGARIVQGSDYPIPPVPLSYLPHLGAAKTKAIMGIRNRFDRDWAMKRAIGVDEEALTRASRLLPRA